MKYKKHFTLLVLVLIITPIIIIAIALRVHFNWYFRKNIEPNSHINPNIDNKRAFVLVIENNNHVNIEFKDETTIKQVIAFVTGTSVKEIEPLTFEEITDDYLEDYLASKILSFTSQYQKTIYLTDEMASYENFISKIEELTKDGYEIDILLDLHGGRENIWFYNETIDAQMLESDLNSINPSIGFVYQTMCYGSTLLPTWNNVATANVNGSVGTNYYVMIAPIVFMEKMWQGYSFKDATIYSRQYEIDLYKLLSNMFPDAEDLITEAKQEESTFEFLY